MQIQQICLGSTHLLFWLLLPLLCLFLKVWRDTVVHIERDRDSVKQKTTDRVTKEKEWVKEWVSQKKKKKNIWQTYFSPATLLVSFVSVPFICSSQPPDIFGRLLFFWIFFSSLISSDRKPLKALSPVRNKECKVWCGAGSLTQIFKWLQLMQSCRHRCHTPCLTLTKFS